MVDGVEAGSAARGRVSRGSNADGSTAVVGGDAHRHESGDDRCRFELACRVGRLRPLVVCPRLAWIVHTCVGTWLKPRRFRRLRGGVRALTPAGAQIVQRLRSQGASSTLASSCAALITTRPSRRRFADGQRGRSGVGRGGVQHGGRRRHRPALGWAAPRVQAAKGPPAALADEQDVDQLEPGPLAQAICGDASQVVSAWMTRVAPFFRGPARTGTSATNVAVSLLGGREVHLYRGGGRGGHARLARPALSGRCRRTGRRRRGPWCSSVANAAARG